MNSNLIPVLTVSDNKYKQPTQNEGGLYVVDKGVLKDAPTNKFYFYNPYNGKYYNINEQTASPDYLKQIKDTEEQIKQSTKGFSDTTDSTQINSVADVASILLSGDVFGAIGGAFELIGNTIIDPLFNPALKGERTKALFNNFLVNLGETLDYATGANAVKALIQGKDISDGYIWDDKNGRNQYDWSVKTGAGKFADTATNIFLEIVSDPTNWITFGGKSLLVNAAKSSVGDVAVKAGLTVNTEYVEKYFKHLRVNSAGVYSADTFDLVKAFNLPNTVTTEYLYDLTKSLKTAMETKAAFKHVNLVNSVLGGIDYVQRTAFKTALSTSALGLEAMGVYKIGKEWALPWIKNRLDDLLKYKKTNGEFKLSNYVEIYDDAKDTVEVYNDLTGVYEQTSTEFANAVTTEVRSGMIRELQSINGIKDFGRKVTTLEKWAVENGYTGIQDAYDKLKNIRDNLHGEVTYMVNILEAVLEDIAVQLDNVKLGNIEAMLELMTEASSFKQFDINTVYEDNPIKELVVKSARYDKLIEGLPTKDLFSPEQTKLLVGTLGILKYHNVVEGLEYIATAVNRIDPDNLHLESVDELLVNLDTIVGTIGLNLNAPRLVDNSFIGAVESTDDLYTVLNSVHDMAHSLHRLLYDLRHYGVKDIDAFYELLSSIESIIERVKASSNWKNYIDVASTKLTEHKRVLIENGQKKTIDFSGYTGAHIRGVLTKVGTTHMSDILKKTLKEAGREADTTDVFLHFKDYNDLPDVEHEFVFNDLLPNTFIHSVGSVDSLEKLFDYFCSVLERFNFYGVDTYIDFIKTLYGKVAKIKDTDAVYIAYETPMLLLNTPDIEEAITVLRRIARDIVSNVSKDVGAHTVEKEIPKEFIKKVWSKEWTEEVFREHTGVEYNKVYLNTDRNKWYVKVISTPAVNASNVESADIFEAIADNLEDYLERLRIEAGKIYISPEQLSSPIYSLMVSKAKSLMLLMNNDAITKPLTRILNGEGIGAVIRTLKQYEDIAYPAEVLHSLAVSTQVYADIMLELNNSEVISDEWKGAIIDSIAGIVRKHYTDIHLDDLTDELLSSAKLYLNKKNNSLPSVSKYVGHTFKPEHHVDVLASVLFGSTVKDVKHIYDEEYTELVQNIIPKAVNDKEYNIAFSIGQHSKRAGVFEFVCELPDEVEGYGKRVHFVDDTTNVARLYSDPRYAEEILGQDCKNTQLVGDYAPDAVHFATTDEFVVAVSRFLEALKTHVNPPSSKEVRTMRFVGFGNSSDYNNQNEVLRTFLRTNRIDFYLDDHTTSRTSAKTLDIKQWLHTNYGAVTVDEDLYNAVKAILFKSKQTLDNYNAGVIKAKASLLPDLSRGVQGALNELLDSVDAALNNRKRGYKDAVGTTKSLMRLPKRVLDALYGELKSFSDAVVTGLRNIRNANREYEQEWIIGDLFNKITGEPNIMFFFNKYVFDTSDGGVFDNSLRRKHNPELVASWYGEDFLKVPRPAVEIEEINALLKTLQHTADAVVRRELVYSTSSWRSCEKVIQPLQEFLKKSTYSSVVRRNIGYIERMQYALLPEQLYAVAYYYMKEFKRLPEKTQDKFRNTVVSAWNLKDKASANYWGLVYNAQDTVLNRRKGLYLPEIDSFAKMRFNESHDVYYALETQKAVESAKHTATCYTDFLKAQNSMLTEAGVNGSVFHLKRDVLIAYNEFADVANNEFIKARQEFLYEIRKATNDIERYAIKQSYTNKIAIIQAQLNKVAEFHARARSYIILHMKLEDYEKYLYRYSQGIQVFDTNSTLFKNGVLTKDFLKRIKLINSEDNKTSLRTYAVKGHVIVYIDKANTEYIESLRDSVIGHEVDGNYIPGINMHFDVLDVLKDLPDDVKTELGAIPYFRAYLKLQNAIEFTHNVSYSMSMHRTMNVDRFRELLEFLPEEVKSKTLDLDYWVSTGYLNGALSHTMVGDYSSGLGTVFKTYSGNLIVNINSGVNNLYKQSMSREGTITFFTSPANSLKARLDMYEQAMRLVDPYFKPLTAAEIGNSIKEAGFKVASFDGSTLTPYDIVTEADLEKAISNKAVLMDAGVYDKLFRTIVDNSISTNWFTDYMFLLKIGLLQSPGWIFRNIIDSMTKGMIASEAGLIDYARMITTTFKKLREFERIQDLVLKEYKSLSEPSIRKLYEEHPEKVAGIDMSLEEALEYMQFSKNSASVPTATQLSALSNVRDNLKKMFPEDSKVTVAHIDMLLQGFVKCQGNKSLVRDYLKERLDDDIVDALMNVINKIPKGYAKAHGTNIVSRLANLLTEHNPLMIFNNYVERLSRFTVYNYNRSLGKTTGAAIEAVNASQFNRTYDHSRTKVLEMFFPFSSFQIDNTAFWIKTLANAKGSLLNNLVNILQGYNDEEDVTPEEIATNLSVQYMFLQGNLMLDYDGDLVLKTGNSLFSTLNLLADPIGTLRDSLNIPTEKLLAFIGALNQNVEEYKSDPYGKQMPIELWTDKDYEEYAKENGLHSFAVELIPVIGAWWLRAQSSWEDPTMDKASIWLRRIMPSVLGSVKRTGYDWYGENNNEEYHKTHTFVPGISYVPTWMLSNPMTYANTIQRLQDMGYDEDTAKSMVVDWGYYMKAPDYVLRRHTPKVSVRKPTYTKKVYAKKMYPKKFNMISGGDRYRTTKFGVARIYRLTSMYDRITKSGTSRMTMMLGRGHGASSIRVVRDRIKNNTIRRQRQRRMLHM